MLQTWLATRGEHALGVSSMSCGQINVRSTLAIGNRILAGPSWRTGICLTGLCLQGLTLMSPELENKHVSLQNPPVRLLTVSLSWDSKVLGMCPAVLFMQGA